MADTQMTYNMRFNADTSTAKKQIEELSKSLDKLVSGSGQSTELPLTKDLVEAQNKVIELKNILNSAMNTNTGKLDLTKFNDSLKKSGTSLKDYQKVLLNLGSEGQSSFLKLSQAISQSEIPLKRTSSLMKDFANTMKNTVKWQLSSSMMHGFMSAISSAWNYAKDLNESLNNIRIVTGYNVDQMSAFADQANRAAKALSTTTTAYTDASLIYYQQGLSDREAAARTETTLKLSNVSGQTVTESADQMTTIWNNYAEGAENLEYYADVLVKLGAATASSSEEIATGISKFAATGKTVGLSYEYATAALATVTATTRESADTVGTAFKTLFARIQDLEQGKTLDDGTTLGQYAEALQKIGVNVKTATGEVKEMDQILDETGAKWGTLSQDAKIALAENVAGVRQYTQFMALMEHWDFFKENVQLAEEATGTLEEQQEIYAEGWEAASKRATASLQNIYQNVIDDEFFIGLTDKFASLLDGIGDFTKTLGGLKGVVLTLTPILLNMFGSELSTGIDNIIFKISSLTGQTKKELDEIKKQNMSGATNFLNTEKSDLSDFTIRSALTQNEAYLKKINEYSNLISEEDQKQLQIQQELVRLRTESLINQGQLLDQEQEKFSLLKADFDLLVNNESTVSVLSPAGDGVSQQKTYTADETGVDALTEKINQLQTERQKLEASLTKAGNQSQKDISNKIKQIDTLIKEHELALEKLTNGKFLKNIQSQVEGFEDLSKTAATGKQILAETSSTMEKLSKVASSESVSKQEVDQIQAKISALKELYSSETEEYDMLKKVASALQEGDFEGAASKYQAYINKVSETSASLSTLRQSLLEGAGALRDIGNVRAAENIENLVSGMGQISEKEAKASSDTVLFNAGIKEMADGLDKLGVKSLTTGQSIVAFGNICATLGSTINMLVSSVSTLFNKDAGGWQKLAAGFMLVSQASRLLDNNMKKNIASLLVTIENSYRAANGQEKLTLEQIKGSKSLKELSSQFNISLGAIGAVTIAISALILILTALSEAEDRAIEKAEAASEKAQEVADAKAEEAESNQELIDSYNTALKAYEEDEEQKEALVTAALAAADAYEIEGAAVAELTGDYKDLTAAIIEARKEELKDNKKDYLNAQYTAGKELEAKWKKIDVGDNGNITAFGTGQSVDDSYEDYQEANTLYKDIFKDNDFELLGQDGQTSLNLDLQLDIDEINAENIVQAYEEIQTLRNAILASDNEILINSNQMETLTEWQDQLESAYEDYIKYSDLIQETNIELASTEVTIGEGSDKKGLYDLETIQEYEQYKKALIESVAEEQGITEEDAEAYADLTAAVEAYLGTISDVSDLQKNDKGISELADKYGLDEKRLQEYFESLSPEKQELFWSIDFDRAQSDSAFDLELDRLQAKANSTSLEVAIETISNAKETFSSDMSTSELVEWKDSSGLNWGGQFEGTEIQIIEFSEFLKMSATEQEAYLSRLNENTKAYLEEEKANEKAALEEQLQEAEAKRQKLENVQKEFDSKTSKKAIEVNEKALNAVDSKIAEIQGELDALEEEKEIDIIINTKEAQEQLDDFLSRDDLEIGAIIDVDELNLLKSLGIENLEQYLLMMDDGTARLVGSAEGFVSAIERSSLNKVEKIQSAQEENFDGWNSSSTDVNLFSTSEKRTDDFKKSQVNMLSDAGYDTTGVLDVSGNIDDLELLDQLLIQCQTDYELNSNAAKEYASTLGELQAAHEAGVLTDEEYSVKLLEESAQYENAVEEIAKYQAALNSKDAALIESAELELELATIVGEQAALYDLDGDALETYTRQIYENNQAELENVEGTIELSGAQVDLSESAKKLAKDEKLLTKQAADTARAQTRIMNGTQDLIDNWDDWKDSIQKANKELKTTGKLSDTTEKEFSSVRKELKKVVKELLDLDDESFNFLSDDFVDNNLDLIEDVKNGVEGAWDELSNMATQDFILNLGVDLDSQDILSGLNSMMDTAQASMTPLELTAYLNSDEFLAQANAIVQQAGLTAEQANAYFKMMGYDVEITEDPEEIKELTTTKDNKYWVPAVYSQGETLQEGQGNNFGTVNLESGGYWESETDKQKEESAKPAAYAVKAITPSGAGAGGNVSQKTASGGGGSGSGGSSGGGGGGGSSSPAKKVKKTKFTELGDRYHTITKRIDNQARATDKLAKLEDRLYGAAKLKAMKEQSAELLKQKELLEQKREEAEAYLKEDTQAFEDQLANWNTKYGTNFKAEYDENGVILNYREIAEAMTATINAWEDQLNSYSTQEEQDSDENQQFQEELDADKEEALATRDQYIETIETLQEIEDSIEEVNDNWQSAKFEEWSTKLEYITDSYERLISAIEHSNTLLGNSADNVFKAVSYMKTQQESMGVWSQEMHRLIGEEGMALLALGRGIEAWEAAKNDPDSGVGELYEKYHEGEINQAQFVEGLKELQSEFWDMGDGLVELWEDMLDDFAEAIEDSQERLSEFAEKIDNAASQIDHYTNLLDLVGRSQDYETKGKLLESQVRVKAAKAESSQEAFNMYKTQYEQAQAYYDALTSDAQREAFQQTLDSSYEAMIQSQEDFLAATEEYAEALKASAENTIEAVNKEITEAILGEDKTWDAVNDQIDRYSSVGEEYLTTTNKIYEVTKLTRDIQSKIDSTSNTAAQQRLATFKKQTEELSKQENLTTYELELQQKKYDLLQAEIALEEAQNAKSQVRLTRDSEGNYSYTYTADEDTLQSAEDEYLEKQNALYNYALEGSNDYYTKFVQTTQEYQEKLKELQLAYLSGEIETEEEYNRQKLEITEYYSNLLTTYKNLYNLSIDELGAQSVESWTTQSGLIISTTDDTVEDVGQSVNTLNNAFQSISKTLGIVTTDSLRTMGNYDEDIKNEILNNHNPYFEKAEDAINSYKDTINDVQGPIKDVLDTMVEEAGNAAEQAESAALSMMELTNSISEQLSAVMEITNRWVEYADAVELVRQALSDLQQQNNNAIEDETWGEGEETGEATTPSEEVVVEPSSANTSDDSGLLTDITYDMILEIYNAINHGYWPTGYSKRQAYAKEKGYPDGAYEIAQEVVNDVYTIPNKGNGSFTNQVDAAIKHELEKAGYAFDTGGYTGEWGEDGRLALLHQKELVLNAADTQNMLSAVEIVRDLIQTLDLNALSSTLGGINALNSGWNNFNNDTEKLEQEIHIEANFPNATDRNEIMEAFSGLVDLASQYAGR